MHNNVIVPFPFVIGTFYLYRYNGTISINVSTSTIDSVYLTSMILNAWQK